MGFKDALDSFNSGSDSSDTSTSSSSGGSSTSSRGTTRQGLKVPSGTKPDDFPIYSIAKPYAALTSTDDGHEFRTDADVTAVEMQATWYGTWEYADMQPGEWSKVWWSHDEFMHTRHVVEQETEYDFRKLLSRSPDKAADIIRESARSYETDDSGISMTRTCQCCGEELHIRYDEIAEVGDQKRPVCDDHTAGELADADLL